MPRKPLAQADISSFRDAYCDAAYELYQQSGFDAVSMRAIARQMGCSPMMAYRYFENKDEVFAALRARLFDRLADKLEAVSNEGGALAYLEALGMAYAEFARDEPQAYRLLYMTHMGQSGDHPETERAQKRTRKVLFVATKAVVAAGALQEDPSILAHTFWAGIHGLVSLDLAGQLTQGAKFDQLLPALLRNRSPSTARKNSV